MVIERRGPLVVHSPVGIGIVVELWKWSKVDVQCGD